jgi:ComF family protein
MRFLEKIFQSINQQLLPSACIVCEYHQQHSICESCLQTLKEDGVFNYECCYQCGISLDKSELEAQRCNPCKMNPPHFDETYCLDRYEGVLQNAMHQLKYQKRLAYAHGLASVWNQIFSEYFKHTHANYLLPVPLSIQKLSARGFNQSWEIARRIDCQSTTQKLPYALKREHNEYQQAGSGLATRRMATQGVFYIDAGFTEILRGQRVIVFDDVMTSGATLDEIARVLKDNGVLHVTNWVVLRTAKVPHV